MKPIECKLYIFPDGVDYRTASPYDAKQEILFKSVSSCRKYVKENGITNYIIFELGTNN